VRAAHFWLQAFDPDEEERARVEGLLRDIDEIRHHPALFGYGHGDFSPATLLAGGPAAAAVDWEHGRKRKLPWMDPLTFALETALLTGEAGGEGALAGLHDAFVGDGPLRAVTDRFLSECLEEGGVPPGHLRVALPALAIARAHRAARVHSPRHRAALRWRAVAEALLEQMAEPCAALPA
jgi:hypothetical protein